MLKIKVEQIGQGWMAIEEGGAAPFAVGTCSQVANGIKAFALEHMGYVPKKRNRRSHDEEA